MHLVNSGLEDAHLLRKQIIELFRASASLNMYALILFNCFETVLMGLEKAIFSKEQL